MSAAGRDLTLPARNTPVATLRNWTPWPYPNSSLIGHCEVIFAGGWVVSGIPVFRRSDGSLSVGQPNAAQLDRDGRIKTDASPLWRARALCYRQGV
jgi:hypothetical protein